MLLLLLLPLPLALVSSMAPVINCGEMMLAPYCSGWHAAAGRRPSSSGRSTDRRRQQATLPCDVPLCRRLRVPDQTSQRFHVADNGIRRRITVGP